MIGAVRSGLLGSAVDLPDEVVSRPDDGDVSNNDQTQGLKIELKSNWQSIGARISNNTQGATRAYLWDSNQSTIDSLDISALSSGDAFAFEDVNLASGEQYYIVLDAEGEDHDTGFFSASDPYPYVGDSLNIIARWTDQSGDDNNDPIAVNDIGKTGLV